MTKRYRPANSKAPQAVGGRARARKLSAERRHEIAMMGARASAQKEGRPLIEDELRIIPPSVRKEMYKNAAEHKLIAELMFDPPAWMQHFLINYETGNPFVLYPEQETFLREAFSPDPETLKLKYDTVIFAAPKKSGKCLEINDLVPLANGKLEQAGCLVGKTFELLTLDSSGRPLRVSASAAFNAVEPVYCLTTDSGWSVVRNAEHPFFVGTRRKPWKESIVSRGFEPLSNLRPGDLIAVAEEIPAFGTHRMPDEAIKLLAYMIADGCCTHCTPTYIKPTSRQSEEFVTCARAIGCLVANPNPMTWRARGKSRAGGNPLVQLLKEHGVYGKRSEQKCIPEAVYSLPKRQLALFLSRLFGGDGWANISPTKTGIRPEIGYSTASKPLAMGIKHLLARFGIHARYRAKPTKCNGVSCQTAHMLYIHRVEDVERFAKEIGMYGKEAALAKTLKAAQARKSYDWVHHNAPPGCRWEKVKSIQKLAPSATVAIEVPDHHTFITPLYEHNTALAAMCLLYVVGVLGGERAEGYIVSNSREQASDRVFADCCSILKASPQLSGFANVTNDAIEFPATNSFIKTVTTEASSAAGSRPTIVVGDEIWGFTSARSVRLWDELAPTPTALVSVRLIVTYAGYTGESELLEKYYRRIFAEDGTLNPGVVQIAPDLYAQGRTLVYWTHEMRAPWQTPEWVETMRREYSPNQFARIMENRWVNSESSFIEATSYDRCVDRKLQPAQANKGMRVWVGLDASLRRDSTAIVAVALDTVPEAETASLLRNFREREVLSNPILEIAAALPWAEDYTVKENPVTLSTLRLKLVWHRIFVPQGRTINFSRIEEAILLLHRSFDVAAVAYDPTQMVAVAQGLTRFGVKMVELPPTQANSMAFSSLLRDLIEQNRLRVYPADDLRQHVLAAASKESQRGWHIVKQSGAVKIDAAVALAEACHVAARYCAPNEVFMSSPSLIGDSLYGI